MLSDSKEIDILFSSIDKMYRQANGVKAKRKAIDLVLSQVDDSFNTTLLTAFLSITKPHKEEFMWRKNVVDILKQKAPDRPGLWVGLE